MKIEVTSHDIRYAKAHRTRSETTARVYYNSFQHCPIARAARRLNPKADISVGADLIYVDDKHCVLPSIAQNFIEAFDEHSDVVPIEFEVC